MLFMSTFLVGISNAEKNNSIARKMKVEMTANGILPRIWQTNLFILIFS